MTHPIDSRTAAYWPLDEQHDSLLPSEASGRLADVKVPAGLTRPTVVDGTVTGFGRDFVRASTPGLVVTDSAGAARLTRGVTVAAIARLDVAQLAAGNRCVLVQRGRGGAGDPMSYRLAVDVIDVATRHVALHLDWQTEAGADVSDPGVTFIWPSGEFLLLAATREVVGGTLAVRYQVNHETFVSLAHALDCGGLASADLSLGVGMNGVAYENHLDGVLDSLHLLDEAVSPEEFAWTWYRMATALPEGVATMRGLVPPGVYSTDPESRVQRELAVEGTAMGYAKTLARRLRNFFLPDAAFGEVFARWERQLSHAPKPGDHLTLRRDRVLSFLGTIRGFAIEDVQVQLAERFDLLPAQVEVIEYSNDYSQAFLATTDALVITGNLDHWSVGGGVLEGDTGAFAGDPKELRYGGAADPRAGLYLWPLAHGSDARVHGLVNVPALLPTEEGIVGLALGRRDLDEWLFVGLRRGSPNEVRWFKYQGGVLGAHSAVVTPWDTTPTAFRIHWRTDGTVGVQVGANDAAAEAFTPVVISPGLSFPQWAGFCIAAPSGQPDTIPLYATFDNFFTRTPNGHQRFNWYAYRNPGLAGNPDMIGAREVVRRIKPAHTIASACTTKVVTCDDASNGCDQAPIGS